MKMHESAFNRVVQDSWFSRIEYGGGNNRT